MRRRRAFLTVDLLEDRLALTPTLAPLPDQFVQEGNLMAVQAMSASPGVTYSLVNTITSFNTFAMPPTGMTVDPTSGLVFWQAPSQAETVPVTVQATDNTGSATQSFVVHVFDNAPLVQTGVNTSLVAGGVLVRSGSFVDPDPDTWNAFVDYGDGRGTSPLPLNLDKTFTLGAIYPHAGTFTVAVTVNDSQGGQGRGFFSVTVTAPVVTPTPPVVTTPVVVTPVTITKTTTTKVTVTTSRLHIRHPKLRFINHIRRF